MADDKLIQAYLNDILLNEIVHAILLLVLVIIYVDSLMDHKIERSQKDRDFSMFILFCTVYIGLMLF